MKKKVKMNPELNNFRELMDFCYENYKDIQLFDDIYNERISKMKKK